MHLIDTNVMMAASAISDLSGLSEYAMPLEPEYREIVFEWLAGFDQSDDSIVLDDEGLIWDEYYDNMPFNMREQEYGLLLLQSKIDNGLVDYVTIETIEANGEHIAILEPKLEGIVTDRDDRKWVACALAARIIYGAVPPIVYGAETDWLVIEDRLQAIGLQFIRLLPDAWYEERT